MVFNVAIIRSPTWEGCFALPAWQQRGATHLLFSAENGETPGIYSFNVNIYVFQTQFQDKDTAVGYTYETRRCDDFRKRLDLTLHHPGAAWPVNDPEKWVAERKYNERDLKQSLENLISERRKSIAWLKTLQEPDWNAAHEHQAFGTISAGDILCAWLAHDYFHARQISNILMQYAKLLAEPFSIRYAL